MFLFLLFDSKYEGMINNKGITAFSTPEQNSQFSSLDALNVKPVVLAKSFSLVTPATSLGMTTSRGGISGRRVVFALMNGQINAIDRRMLDPRRPVGDLSEAEKTEGIVKYTELMPIVAPFSLCYNQTIEGVTTVLSSATDLESQTIVLAFGGPDIFFVRTSPSKGFDLLPDSFNRALLSLVVVALLVVLVVVKGLAKKKVKEIGWI